MENNEIINEVIINAILQVNGPINPEVIDENQSDYDRFLLSVIKG